MPATVKKSTRPQRRRVYRRSKLPMKRVLPYRKDYARIVEDLPGEVSLLTNNLFSIKNFQISSCARASAVAQGYQHYRIAKVELFIKPNQDTYIADAVAAGTGQGIPYFYYKIDRLGTVPPVATVGTLKRMGVKPIRIDDKVIKVAFKPSVIYGATDNSPSGSLVSELSAMHKVSPWLTTNANSGNGTGAWAISSVDHYGIVFGTEAQRKTGDYFCASVQIRMTFEFKDPLWNAAATVEGQTYPALVNHVDTTTLRTANFVVT